MNEAPITRRGNKKGVGNPNWKKGVSGSPLGKRPGTIDIKGIYRKAMEKAVSNEDRRQRIEAIVERVIALALDGEEWAIKECTDRVAGKPGQEVKHVGELAIKTVVLHKEIP